MFRTFLLAKQLGSSYGPVWPAIPGIRYSQPSDTLRLRPAVSPPIWTAVIRDEILESPVSMRAGCTLAAFRIGTNLIDCCKAALARRRNRIEPTDSPGLFAQIRGIPPCVTFCRTS